MLVLQKSVVSWDVIVQKGMSDFILGELYKAIDTCVKEVVLISRNSLPSVFALSLISANISVHRGPISLLAIFDSLL